MSIISGLKKNVAVVLRTVILSSEVQKLEKRLTGKSVISLQFLLQQDPLIKYLWMHCDNCSL